MQWLTRDSSTAPVGCAGQDCAQDDNDAAADSRLHDQVDTAASHSLHSAKTNERSQQDMHVRHLRQARRLRRRSKSRKASDEQTASNRVPSPRALAAAGGQAIIPHLPPSDQSIDKFRETCKLLVDENEYPLTRRRRLMKTERDNQEEEGAHNSSGSFKMKEKGEQSGTSAQQQERQEQSSSAFIKAAVVVAAAAAAGRRKRRQGDVYDDADHHNQQQQQQQQHQQQQQLNHQVSPSARLFKKLGLNNNNNNNNNNGQAADDSNNGGDNRSSNNRNNADDNNNNQRWQQSQEQERHQRHRSSSSAAGAEAFKSHGRRRQNEQTTTKKSALKSTKVKKRFTLSSISISGGGGDGSQIVSLCALLFLVLSATTASLSSLGFLAASAPPPPEGNSVSSFLQWPPGAAAAAPPSAAGNQQQQQQQQVTTATNSPQSSASSSATVGCPYPPVNSNCQVNIIAQAPAVPLLNTEFVADEYSTLKQDTQAIYKCDHGYELLGAEQITCLASGRWSATPPNCVTNIALGKPTNQSSTVRGGDSRNANDGKLITQHDSKFCTETKVDQSPWWQIDLLQVYEVRSIRILGRACCNPQLSLHDIEIRVGNSSTLQGNRLCAWYPSNLDEGAPRDFQCAHPILGRFVSIQMVGIESALSLCEVMVFSTKEFHPDRCNIQTTLAPSSSASSNKLLSQSSVTTTTSATTTQQTSSNGVASDNQIVVFNRTCYEIQATNGGSFLVADTYCKARGGSLLHSVSDLTQSFISQELERMKLKLKSKLVWLGAKRETASPNAQGPITPGSTSALIGSDSVVHHTFGSDRSLSASALHEFPIENLFSNDHGLISIGETSSIFSPSVRVSRSALLQASSGAGGSTSRGSQTFGLQTSNNHHHHHHPTNRSIEHPGRSLIISQPSQVASYFTSPVPATSSLSQSGSIVSLREIATSSGSHSPSSSSSSSPASQPSILLQQASSNPVLSFSSSGNTHVHRTLRPPSLVSAQASAAAASSIWNPSKIDSSNSGVASAPTSQPSSFAAASTSWRWVGDAPSDTLLSPVTNFLWADDQPNNYNNQQDCIVMDGAKRWLWNDVTCELDYLPWVCQYRASTCGSPDRHENSTILEVSSSSSEDGSTEKAYQLGKTITYVCPVGHRLDGSRTRKCLYDGSWSGKAPKCQYVNCGSIGSQTIENGRVVYLNQSQTTFGSQAKYVCYEDYVLVGDDTRQCQGDGRWAGKQPYCAYKWCPVLQPISNGQLNVSSYSENSIATYQCNSGYKLIGNDTRQCLLGGKWTNQEPFCQYVDCGQPKQIPNGSHQLVNGTTNYLSVVLYTCNENYTLVGSSNKMICSHNNRWTGREPQCSLIDCGQPQALAGSRFTGDSFTVHSTIEYKCDPGFKEVSGSTQRTCGLDGQWTGQPLACKYVDCGRVPAILKGEVSYINGTTYLASQVSYECTPGNRISGHRVRFCGPDARWTGTSPKCEEVRCDAPELPANGSAIYIGNDRSFKEQSFSVGVTVQYECDYGHVVKGSWASRLCQANGEWSGEPPLCRFVDCGPPPSIENGNYLLRHPPAGSAIGTATPVELTRRSDGGANSGSGAVGTFTYYGTIAHYNCDANYKLLGPAQRECLESGQWRTPMPTCEPVQCPRPEFFDEYTQVSLISKSQAADLLTQQQASSGDHQSLVSLAAAKSIKLIANSQWLNANGQSYGANHSFGVGDKLYYSCVPGYELYGGPEIRTCTQYAQWSGSSTPRCRLIDCGKPAPIGQEGRYYLLNDTTTFNSLVEYSCVRPYKLVEVKIRQAGNLIETLTNAQAGVTPILTSLPIGVKVCANNGQWMPNDQQPKCTTGGVALFDGVDNTLTGSNRQVQIMAGGGGSGSTSLGGGQPSFAGDNGIGAGGISNQDGDGGVLDSASSSGRQQSDHSQSAYFWAKVLLVISLPLMFAIITVTLICIRSKKEQPKQMAQRTSILTSSGHQAAAAAAAAMQIQLASNGNNKGSQQQQQQQQQVMLAHSVRHGHHINGAHPNQQQQQQQHPHRASMMNGQNIYINGMAKMAFPGAMVGTSQMSTASQLDQSSLYGDAVPTTTLMAANASAAARSMMAINQGEPIQMNGGGGGGDGIRLPPNATGAMDSYSRLSIDSDQQHQANHNLHPGGGLGHKTIRHNPNGLVTFVSPAQQQQQQKNSALSQQPQTQVSTSSSSGVSSSTTSHQISPQSISTPLSVSSSSSPSSTTSSSSAHHTMATRLSGTDLTSSPTSSNSGGINRLHHRQHPHHHSHQNQQQVHHNHMQESEYQAPQVSMQQVAVPQTSPPSLPAHPPPPHRVQLHHKQLMKHQNPKQQQKQQQQQQSASVGMAPNGKPGDHHYMEPSVQ